MLCNSISADRVDSEFPIATTTQIDASMVEIVIDPALDGSEPPPESNGDAGVEKLRPEHREQLRRSGLTDETITLAGFQSVSGLEATTHGFPAWSGLLIPYPGYPDYVRLRPDDPPKDENGSAPKYLSPKESRNHLYIPPGVEQCLQDKSKALLITEGEKKALKSTQDGFPTLGLSGVWNWKTKAEGVLPELKAIKWKGRKVFVVFDSDLRTNSEVQAAQRGLVKELENSGATVRVVSLPSSPNGEKVGLDDYLVAHSPSDLRALLDKAGHLLDETLKLIEKGLDPTQLEKRLQDVYRTMKLYPTSIKQYAEQLRQKLTKAGYSPPCVSAIEKLVERVDPFLSDRTEEDKDDGGLSPDLDAKQAAEAMLNDCYRHADGTLTLRLYKGDFYEWKGTHYVPLQESDLGPLVMRYLQQKNLTCRESFVGDVIGNLKGFVHLNTDCQPTFRIDQADQLGSAQVTPEWVIAFQDCLVPMDQLLGGTVYQDDHSPAWFNLVGLPYEFDPEAKCPKWVEFLNQVLDNDPDLVALVQQMFGYCLTHSLKYQKFFILHGPGANGKSVVLEILEAMLGQKNVSHLSLDQFSDRFSLGAMEGKLANIYADLEELEKVDEGRIKTLTCGEAIQIDRKYKEPRPMYPTAKLVFSTNSLPNLRDRSQGIWRRLIVIPFEVTIPESQQDKGLADKLKTELSGIFNWAVEGFKKLQQQGVFIEPAKCRQVKSQHRRDSDPVLVFLDECVADDPAKSIPCDGFYDRYKTWCEAHGHKPLNNANLGKELRMHKPDVKVIAKKKALNAGPRQTRREYQGLDWIPLM